MTRIHLHGSTSEWIGFYTCSIAALMHSQFSFIVLINHWRLLCVSVTTRPSSQTLWSITLSGLSDYSLTCFPVSRQTPVEASGVARVRVSYKGVRVSSRVSYKGHERATSHSRATLSIRSLSLSLSLLELLRHSRALYLSSSSQSPLVSVALLSRAPLVCGLAAFNPNWVVCMNGLCTGQVSFGLGSLKPPPPPQLPSSF